MFDEELVAKLRVRLVRYASSKGIGRAEDIAQETLVVLWMKYSHLDLEADWFLWRTASVARKYLRRTGFRRARVKNCQIIYLWQTPDPTLRND